MEFFMDYARPLSETVSNTVLSKPRSCTFELENALFHIREELPYINMANMEPDYLWECIKTVIYHEPTTIVKWKDGTKTVVKCCESDTYDKEKGLMACIIKKWNEIMKEWVNEDS